VSAYNAVFEGTRSSSTEIIAATEPAQPDPVTRSASGLQDITISWTAPDDGDNPITGYVIQADDGLGGAFSQVGTTGAATLSFTHTSLTNGQVYGFRVIA